MHGIDASAHFHLQRGFSWDGRVGAQGHAVRLANVYLIGCIVYEDSRGRRRETGFCRMSEGAIRPWQAVRDSEYEYQD